MSDAGSARAGRFRALSAAPLVLRRGLYTLAAVLAAVSCAWTCTAIFSPRLLGSYLSVHAPVTGSTDYIASLPNCAAIGPSGMIDDGSSLYVSDWCDSTTYQYAAGVQAPPRLINHALNGLTDGLAFDQGSYYGIAGLNQTAVVRGIYAFNPRTLTLARLVAPLPCHDTRGLAADPQTGDLYVTGDCGLARISDPGSAHPTSVMLVRANFDGVAVAPDGQSLWVANTAAPGMDELSPDGHLITAIPIPAGPVGVTIVDPATPSQLAGDVLVSDNDSSLIYLDVHKGNALSVLAAGGNRGAWLTVGPDGYLYVAKADRVEQVQPAIFGPVTIPGPAASDSTGVGSSAQGQSSGSKSPNGSSTFTLTLIVTAAASAAAVLLAVVMGQLDRNRRRRSEREARPTAVLASPPEPAAPRKQPTKQPAQKTDYARLRGLLAKTRPRRRRLAWAPSDEPAPCPALAGAPRDPQVAKFDPLRRVLTVSQRLPSGTSLRFAVLVLTMIASTASIYAHLSAITQTAANTAAQSCLSHFPAIALTPATAPAVTQSNQYTCVQPYIPSLALWSAAGVLIAVLGSALVYAATPWWIRRFSRPTNPFFRHPSTGKWLVSKPWWLSGRSQRLLELDRADELKRQVAERLDELTTCIDLRPKPTWLYDAHGDVRVFGFRRRTFVTINNGLLTAFVLDRAAFDAMALHELAHLRNRDNRPTYGTLAVWRVFLVATVLPYVVSLFAPGVIRHPFSAAAYRFDAAALDPRIFINSLILITLVFLASRSVMRAREAHADAAAALYDNSGALRKEIAAKGASARDLRLREAVSYHPGWRRRLADLDDPSRLVSPGLVPMLIMGIALALIMVNVGFSVLLGFPDFFGSFSRAILSGRNFPLLENELLINGPSAFVVLATIVAFACLTTWRAHLAAAAAPAPGARTGVFGGALALVLGVMIGVPLSNVYADAGVWGVFDISAPWDLADVAVSALALAAITVLIFAWARESAGVWIAGARCESLRGPLATTVAVGVLGAAPAMLVWIAAQDTSNITSFGDPRITTLVRSWFGGRWAFINYYPHTYLWTIPGTGVLFALPCLYLAVGAVVRRRQARADQAATPEGSREGGAPAAARRWEPPRLSVRRVFTTGLAIAVVCELAGFAIAYAARAALGGAALRTAYDIGGNAPFLPLSWLSWTTVTVCAVAAPFLTRSLRGQRLTATLLTSFVAAGAAAFLLLPPLFTAYCGTAAYSCAVQEPRDLLAAYGLLASQMTMDAAAATALVLGLVLLIGRLPRRATTHTEAAASSAPRASHQTIPPITVTPRRLTVRLLTWAMPLVVLVNALAGVYAFFTYTGGF